MSSQGGISWSDVPAYLAAQVLGTFIGVATAHLMFGETLLQVSRHIRTSGGQLFSEFVATFGLLVPGVLSASCLWHPWQPLPMRLRSPDAVRPR
jgi:glycerol uptake facilitator-like aquaporin